MSDEPKFSFFRLSITPFSSKDGSGQKSRSISPADTASAFFCLGVAIVLILANQLGRIESYSTAAASVAGIKLTLYPQQHRGNQVGLVYKIRLSNMGSHPVFYPVRPGTNFPVGQIVVRDSSSSEWMSHPGSSKQVASTAPGFIDPNPAWIEMPPSGWADGEFHDHSESQGSVRMRST